MHRSHCFVYDLDRVCTQKCKWAEYAGKATCAQLSRETNGPNCDLSLRILPYYVYANRRWSHMQKQPKSHSHAKKENISSWGQIMSHHTKFFLLSANAFFKRPFWRKIGTKNLVFYLSNPLLSYFVHARSEGSDKTAHMHMRSLVWAFAARQCDTCKYRNLV